MKQLLTLRVSEPWMTPSTTSCSHTNEGTHLRYEYCRDQRCGSRVSADGSHQVLQISLTLSFCNCRVCLPTISSRWLKSAGIRARLVWLRARWFGIRLGAKPTCQLTTSQPRSPANQSASHKHSQPCQLAFRYYSTALSQHWGMENKRPRLKDRIPK